MKKEEIFKRKAAEKSTANSHSDQLERIERNCNSAAFFSVIAIVFNIITIILATSIVLMRLMR